jgi:hypothetical protein
MCPSGEYYFARPNYTGMNVISTIIITPALEASIAYIPYTVVI